jgi:hypothetical protein
VIFWEATTFVAAQNLDAAFDLILYLILGGAALQRCGKGTVRIRL